MRLPWITGANLGGLVTASMLCGLAQGGMQAAAQDRLAYVLASTGAEGARADAMTVSRALIGAGVSVIRRENPDPASFDLGATLGAVAPLTMIYFSGPTAQVAGETWLLAEPLTQPLEPLAEGQAPKGWPLHATLAALKARGALQVVAVVQGCHQPGQAGAFAPPPLPPLAPVASPISSPVAGDAIAAAPAEPPADPLDDTLILLASDPGQPCASAAEGQRLTDRFLAATASGTEDLAAGFAAQPGQGWMESRLRHRLPAPVMLPAKGPTTPDAAAALLRSLPADEATRLQRLWAASAAPVAGASPLLTPGTAAAPSPLIDAPKPAAAASPLLAPTPASARNGATTGAGGLRLVEVSARALLAARPTAAGLPRPSVIVGDLAPTPAAFDASGADQPAASATLYGMPAPERASLRAEDASGFAALVESGAFDPAPGEVAAALQTELARMSCYTARVDGDWGNGSRASVDRYFTALRAEAPTREATLELYRAIIGAEDVACPVVREAAAPRPQAQQGTSRRAGTQAAAPTRRAAPAAPAAPAPKPRSGGLNAGALGSGVLR